VVSTTDRHTHTHTHTHVTMHRFVTGLLFIGTTSLTGRVISSQIRDLLFVKK